MGDLPPRRVFFALWPGDEAAAHLAALAHNLAGRGSRLIPAESLHMTLAFIGAVTSARIGQLESLAAEVSGEAFDLRLDRLGFWPQRGIVWAGCRQSPEPLKCLFKSLADGLSGAGFAIDDRTGPVRVPHVSLARHARCRSLPRLGTPIGWHVSEFALIESHLHPTAARYETLAVFPLQDAGAE
ncbi:MAG: RNA 2',3'-cyclic phosphodiesterase [Burkholderiaceae bacterium]|nr:RNA 2',3'-cyclic phosphodiesterase [Sulfuritalea sp.]MCF8176077.1 RNA 2',3'-cyclic phosphodiesterase [Burkholderiaceae bacterium]MCF8184987.1 RNA 2',3'-cyclic phosphodiesterase [Polynucleobacter sp.]